MSDTDKPAQTCLQPKLLRSMDLSHLSYNHIFLGWTPANIVTLCPLHARACWGEEVASNPPVWVLLCRAKAEVWVDELIGHCPVWSPASLQSRGRKEHPSGLGPCDLSPATWGEPDLTKSLCWISVLMAKSRTSLLITALEIFDWTENCKASNLFYAQIVSILIRSKNRALLWWF